MRMGVKKVWPFIGQVCVWLQVDLLLPDRVTPKRIHIGADISRFYACSIDIICQQSLQRLSLYLIRFISIYGPVEHKLGALGGRYWRYLAIIIVEDHQEMTYVSNLTVY